MELSVLEAFLVLIPQGRLGEDPQTLGFVEGTAAAANPVIQQLIQQEHLSQSVQPKLEPAPLQSLFSVTATTAPLESADRADGPQADNTLNVLPIAQTLEYAETPAPVSDQPEASEGVKQSGPVEVALEAGKTEANRLEKPGEEQTLPADPQFSLESLDNGEHNGLLQGITLQEVAVAHPGGAAADKRDSAPAPVEPSAALREQVSGNALGKSYQYGQLSYVNSWWDDGPNVVGGENLPSNILATRQT